MWLKIFISRGDTELESHKSVAQIAMTSGDGFELDFL